MGTAACGGGQRPLPLAGCVQVVIPNRRSGGGGLAPGGRPGPVLVCDPPPPPSPPPRFLTDSGLGGMAPTALNFFLSMLPFHQTIRALCARLARYIPAKTRQRYYHIHTSIPPHPQTHIPPGGMHMVVVGRAHPPPNLGNPLPLAEPPITPPPPPKF